MLAELGKMEPGTEKITLALNRMIKGILKQLRSN